MYSRPGPSRDSARIPMSVDSASRICSTRVSEKCGPIGMESADVPTTVNGMSPSVQTRVIRSIAVSPANAIAASVNSVAVGKFAKVLSAHIVRCPMFITVWLTYRE